MENFALIKINCFNNEIFTCLVEYRVEEIVKNKRSVVVILCGKTRTKYTICFISNSENLILESFFFF
jgi:hypothetical protein